MEPVAMITTAMLRKSTKRPVAEPHVASPPNDRQTSHRTDAKASPAPAGLEAATNLRIDLLNRSADSLAPGAWRRAMNA